MASLDDKVDPSDVLILHEEVGTIASAEDGSICALAQVKLIADSRKYISHPRMHMPCNTIDLHAG